METKNKRTKVVTCVVVLAGLLLVWTLATAGDLQPSGPPAPTMKTLDEIYNAVVSDSLSMSQREGYTQSFNITAGSTVTCFTVPVSKRFVLLRATMNYYMIYLTVNDSLFINNTALSIPSHDGSTWLGDFPDRCAVVDAGATLKIVNPSPTATYSATIVGYFYTIQ